MGSEMCIRDRTASAAARADGLPQIVHWGAGRTMSQTIEITRKRKPRACPPQPATRQPRSGRRGRTASVAASLLGLACSHGRGEPLGRYRLKVQRWLWVTLPDIYVGRPLSVGEQFTWSCHPDTAVGARALLYRAEVLQDFSHVFVVDDEPYADADISARYPGSLACVCTVKVAFAAPDHARGCPRRCGSVRLAGGSRRLPWRLVSDPAG